MIGRVVLTTAALVSIRYSHYWPPLGGTNCSNYVEGQCISRTASGDRWQDWIGTGAACPAELPFGTTIVLEDDPYTVWTCVDRGGRVVTTNGGEYVIDFLEQSPRYGYGTVLTATIYYDPTVVDSSVKQQPLRVGDINPPVLYDDQRYQFF